jgi:hypothetical protein
VAHLWERIFCFSLRIFCFAGFSSPRGFPRINAVSLVIVYFSVILYYAKNYNNGLNINRFKTNPNILAEDFS